MTYFIIIKCNALLMTVTSTKCSCTLLASIVGMTAEHCYFLTRKNCSEVCLCVSLCIEVCGHSYSVSFI